MLSRREMLSRSESSSKSRAARRLSAPLPGRAAGFLRVEPGGNPMDEAPSLRGGVQSKAVLSKVMSDLEGFALLVTRAPAVPGRSGATMIKVCFDSLRWYYSTGVLAYNIFDATSATTNRGLQPHLLKSQPEPNFQPSTNPNNKK